MFPGPCCSSAPEAASSWAGEAEGGGGDHAGVKRRHPGGGGDSDQTSRDSAALNALPKETRGKLNPLKRPGGPTLLCSHDTSVGSCAAGILCLCLNYSFNFSSCSAFTQCWSPVLFLFFNVSVAVNVQLITSCIRSWRRSKSTQNFKHQLQLQKHSSLNVSEGTESRRVQNTLIYPPVSTDDNNKHESDINLIKQLH